MLSTAQPTCFLIADISGYTGYLADVELDHAQDILADLVGAVVMQVIGPAYGAALESGVPSLVAQLDDELAARDADRGPEPELRVPSAAGPLSGLQPLVIIG